MYRPLTQTCRELRKRQTPHERKLWSFLRNRSFQGYKFRRQHQIGSYIVDFCCPEKKIIIELDGGGHAEENQKFRDKERDLLLKEEGYRVLRFWNNELDRNKRGILEQIHRLFVSPSPVPSSDGTPSPQRGEGR